ncbi:MAG: molybdopterin molybdotransferase MoeA [Pseudomonadota bacterium]
MITLSDALAQYPQTLKPLPAETCPLEQALSRVLAQPVASKIDLPLFTQSAVDGYALRAADAQKTLKLTGEVPAGSPSSHALSAGTAMRILTGGALPEGADTVARQEIVERSGETIRLTKPVNVGADTRYRGEELKQGEAIAETGQRLHSGLLAALAMAGVFKISVRRRPRIALLVTGDEIARIGSPLKPGQVYDANGPLMHGWLHERGYRADIQYVPDRPEAVEQALKQALDSSDLVISSGGVSVGDRDYLPQLAPKLGVQKIFWNVAQKPGKPLWYGVRNGAAFMGLPGNPGAVLIGLAVHVSAVLGVLEGHSTPQPEWRAGILEKEVKADAHRDRLVRMTLRYEESGCVHLKSLPRQDSHMLSNLASAGALVWLPVKNGDYAAGETVRWLTI